MVFQLALGVDGEPQSRLGEQRDIHDAVPDRDDLVLLDSPLRRKLSHDLPFALWTDMDRDAARETPVLIVEFVAERRVRSNSSRADSATSRGPPVTSTTL